MSSRLACKIWQPLLTGRGWRSEVKPASFHPEIWTQRGEGQSLNFVPTECPVPCRVECRVRSAAFQGLLSAQLYRLSAVAATPGAFHARTNNEGLAPGVPLFTSSHPRRSAAAAGPLQHAPQTARPLDTPRYHIPICFSTLWCWRDWVPAHGAETDPLGWLC